ncbi:MAG: response regulator [Burkholderiaceae bacterium]|nr:response regulator [Burkholderiaceae bacterium]
MTEPRVYLVDDDTAVLRSLQRLLEAAGMATTAFDSPERFLAAVGPSVAGCAVLDLAMPGLDGLAVQEALARRGCPLPIVFLTGRGNIPASVRAMKLGAVDFLTKPVDVGQLLDAIRTAFERDRQARVERDERQAIDARLATLTAREREVLPHLVAGRLNKQIAADLGTVEKTIKVHRARVLAKLSVRSLADLARLAQRAGIGPARATDD